MKKKLVAILSAALLALALPTMAFAQGSEVQKDGSLSNNVVYKITGAGIENVESVPTDQVCATEVPSGAEVVANLLIDGEGTGDVAITLNNVKSTTDYVQVFCKGGITEPAAAVNNGQFLKLDDQGTVSFTFASVEKPAVITVLANLVPPAGSGSKAAPSNGSDVSPTTGVDFTGIVGVSAAALCAAFGTAMVLRRKLQK